MDSKTETPQLTMENTGPPPAAENLQTLIENIDGIKYEPTLEHAFVTMFESDDKFYKMKKNH